MKTRSSAATRSAKGRVLRQEAVPGMNRLRAGFLSRRYNLVDIEVTGGRIGFTQEDRLVRGQTRAGPDGPLPNRQPQSEFPFPGRCA